MDQILDAFDQINANDHAHVQAAREIAGEYFAAERVLTTLMEDVGL